MSSTSCPGSKTSFQVTALCAAAILVSACSSDDLPAPQSAIDLPLPPAIRQISALEGADLSLEVSINNAAPINYDGQGSSNSWRISIDAPASRNNTIKVTWIETIEQQRVVLAQLTDSFTTGTNAIIIDLNNNYQTSGSGFDHDSDGVSNLAERQNSTDPLVSDSGQFVVNEPDTVSITGGCYSMGSPETETGRTPSERAHDVCVGDFQIGKYEVTFEQYDQFATVTNRRKPLDNDWGRGSIPVMNVSWYDATAYATWLSEQTGKQYRLPTEAEWEYAARAGTTTPFSTGEQITPAQANFNSTVSYNGSPIADSTGRSVDVGSYPPNQWGIHDMHGNQSEWTCSSFSISYVGGELTCNPIDGNTTNSARGGSWSSEPGGLRSAARYRDTPDRMYFYVGFRIAIEN